MAAELLTRHKKKVTGFELVPAGGGVFELSIDGKLIYSKKAMGRFPENGEIAKLMAGGVKSTS